jgi:hypothetical protein
MSEMHMPEQLSACQESAGVEDEEALGEVADRTGPERAPLLGRPAPASMGLALTAPATAWITLPSAVHTCAPPTVIEHSPTLDLVVGLLAAYGLIELKINYE